MQPVSILILSRNGARLINSTSTIPFQFHENPSLKPYKHTQFHCAVQRTTAERRMETIFHYSRRERWAARHNKYRRKKVASVAVDHLVPWPATLPDLASISPTSAASIRSRARVSSRNGQLWHSRLTPGQRPNVYDPVSF